MVLIVRVVLFSYFAIKIRFYCIFAFLDIVDVPNVKNIVALPYLRDELYHHQNWHGKFSLLVSCTHVVVPYQHLFRIDMIVQGTPRI